MSGPLPSIDRRRLLQLMAGAAAMSTAACGRVREEIVPYVRMPERLVPGNPLQFATSLTLDGIAQPVLVESHEGRPTKIEGNPDHPASRGSTDAFAQAAIFSLYDPGRSRVVLHAGQIGTWNDLLGALVAAAPKWRAAGSGLRLLSGAVTSPSLAAGIAALAQAYPGARWHRWQPIHRDEMRRGAEIAFGQRLEPRYRLDQARVVLSLDADLLGPGPEQVLQARDFSQTRRARRGMTDLGRLYVAEPTLTLTGLQADHRLATARNRIEPLVRALAARLGAAVEAPTLAQDAQRFLDSVLPKLQGRPAVVAVGQAQPAAVHALAHWINQKLGAFGHTVELAPPVELDPVDQTQSIAELVADMRAGHVDTLVILGGNPVYDAPADLDFAGALAKVGLAVRLGLYDDETSARCAWHVPFLHELECWGDAAAADGTIGIQQPLITPLYGGISAYDLLAALQGRSGGSAYESVRETWRGRAGAGDFEAWWRRALHDGFVQGTRPAAIEPPPAKLPGPPAPAAAAPAPFELCLHPDASVWDGRFSENAWLQELPQPLTKLVWGNAATVSPPDASKLGLADGDIVRLACDGASIDVPVLVAGGQAEATIGLPFGYGKRTGVIGRDVGASAYPLRRRNAAWALPATLSRTGTRVELATTQMHHRMEGDDLVRRMAPAQLAAVSPAPPAPPSFFVEPPRPSDDPYAWAMVIDQSVCIGCNACVAACQAENNTPVVGPDEVRRGRDMHWLRVDLHFGTAPERASAGFQPVPCMQCEAAPCEPACPVEASVHDSEGLNVQVYNRCVGTRFCQSNCPYKVRRFNFFGYGDGQEYADLGDPMLAAAHNPDVSVRARGVMEKCTYCVQRISRARRAAEKADRRIADGEVQTACQQACPTQAIAFGNLRDDAGAVASLRREPHHYALLEELDTRPRTTYLAQVRASFGEEPS
jgi:molybdopterin-containing oxidoreductase family iron-sulfur binding subunit